LGGFVVALAILSLGARDASALTALELSVAELVAASTSIVSGTPAEAVSVWEDSDGPRGRRIVTYTRVVVDRVLDGNPGADVWVRTLGGAVGTIGQHVDGEAALVPGQRALMFLRRRGDSAHAIVGMAQGHFPLLEQTSRLARPAVGRLVHRPTVTEPAHLVLPGQTVDEVAARVAAERAHAR
jgi:hypothetical protein